MFLNAKRSPLNARMGFTLIEVLTVMAVVVVLAMGSMLFFSLDVAERRLDDDAKSIQAFLRDAQQRSIVQEQSLTWGVYVDVLNRVYRVEGDDTPATVALQRSLRTDIEFYFISGTLPKENPMQFKKITGLPVEPAGDAVRIRIGSSNCVSEVEKCRTVTVSPTGSISYE